MAALSLISGCKKKDNSVLKLYCGAGLRRGVNVVKVEFEKKTGIKVEVDYGGSGIIIARAKEAKDGDLFMPGSETYVDDLQSQSGIVKSKHQVSYFVPTIIVQKGNPKKIQSVKDFFTEGTTVALGKAKACAIGKLSTKILGKSGLDRAKLDAKESLTVNELGIWVKMKDVDASIVWDVIASNVSDSVDAIEIPKDDNVISTVSIAVLTTSKNMNSSEKFIEFITSKEGQAILREKKYRIESPY
jgi:molybdate transport system substrate-binding protein